MRCAAIVVSKGEQCSRTGSFQIERYGVVIDLCAQHERFFATKPIGHRYGTAK